MKWKSLGKSFTISSLFKCFFVLYHLSTYICVHVHVQIYLYIAFYVQLCSSYYYLHTVRVRRCVCVCVCVCMCSQLLSPIWLSCNTVDWSLPGSSAHGDFPGKNTGVGFHFLLQGIFPTQVWDPPLLHWEVGSLPLYHLGQHYYLTWGKTISISNLLTDLPNPIKNAAKYSIECLNHYLYNFICI